MQLTSPTFADAMQYAAQGIDQYSTEELAELASILGSERGTAHVLDWVLGSGYGEILCILALTAIAAELETRHAL